jgi:hypothetical protein
MLNERIEASLSKGYTQKDYAEVAMSYGHLSALLFIEHVGGDKRDKLSDLALQ